VRSLAGRVPRPSRRARQAITLTVGLAVVVALGITLAGRGHDFMTALRAAPLGVLAAATALQLLALLVRTEAWNGCVRATGATAERRRLYHASGVGSVVAQVNGQLGVAARIATLRRSSPAGSPGVPALITAELPIIATEATLAALTSFTLVGPLGLPWWVPLICLAVFGSLSVGLCALARHRCAGPWRGLAALRSLEGRRRVVAFVLVAVVAQIMRNWLVLRATGVDVSLLDSIAVLIAMVTLSQLPVGPSVGAAATVLILGPHGVAAVAAAGVLLTATGTVGALCFAAWAGADWVRAERRLPTLWLRPAPATGP
jgi:hypothetical protein